MLISGGPKVQVIAASSLRPNIRVPSIAKGIYRFLGNNHFDWQSLFSPLYRKSKSLFAGERRILGIIDLSSIEKPHSRKMEGISRVKRRDGKGTTNGYMNVSVLLSWSKKVGLGYFKIFSHQCELMSQNKEIDLAISEVSELLSEDTKVIWVWDRGFDDRKNYRKVLGLEDEFVGRAYHDRLVTVKGKECKLITKGKDLPIMHRFNAKLRIYRKVRRVIIGLSWMRFKLEGRSLWLLRARILWIDGIDVNKIEDQEWWLITNIRINHKKTAKRIWHYYKKRWEIEDFFRFLKEGLKIEKFQVMSLEEIRRIVAIAVIAGMFIYNLSEEVTSEPIKMLLYFGGWTGRDKPGKIVLKRGLSTFLSYLCIDSFLKANEFR